MKRYFLSKGKNERSAFLLLPIFFFALLQGAFLSINLVLLTVILWVVFGDKESLWVAFFAGLFLDLTKGNTLGLSSFLLLLVCGCMRLYRRRFSPTHPAFLSLFTLLSTSLFDMVFYRSLFWKNILINLGIVLIGRFLLVRSFGELNKQRLKLP